MNSAFPTNLTNFFYAKKSKIPSSISTLQFSPLPSKISIFTAPMDLQKHRHYKKSYKLFIRYFIYGVVLLMLLYLIRSKMDSVPKENAPQEIEHFSIETP